MSSPVNGSNNLVFVISLRISDQSHGGQEDSGELFFGIDGELVHSLFVGLAAISVVSLDGDHVLLEDESSVSFLFNGPAHSEFALPFFEGIGFALVGRVVDSQDCECDKRGN